MPKKGGKKANVRRKAKSNNRVIVAVARKPATGRPKHNGAMLDRGGLAYASLLRDPCNSALTGFFGGSAGYIQRFTSTYTIGSTAGSTAGIHALIPGNGYIAGGVDLTNESTAAGVFNMSATNMPGSTFLNATAKECRVLACCVKLFSNASEQQRSGFVFYGNVGVSEIPAAGSTSTYTPAQVETLVPVSVRTPTDCVEIKWMPGENDGNYINTPVGSGMGFPGDSQGLIIGWSGQPAAVGFKVVVTTVVEWLPNITNGFTVDTMRPPTSMNTLQQIKAALYNSSPSWWHKAGQITYRTLSSAMAGYAAGGPAGGLVSGLRALTM